MDSLWPRQFTVCLQQMLDFRFEIDEAEENSVIASTIFPAFGLAGLFFVWVVDLDG